MVNEEEKFCAFEASKGTTKLLFALAKHVIEKNCNHTIHDVLSHILIEKVEEYMIGEDLVGAKDMEVEVN